MQTVNLSTCTAGIDISHYQGNINWQAVKASQQVGFVSIKTTEGATYVDPMLADNVAGAKSVDLPVQMYHFARPSQSSARDEANNFIALIKKFKPELLPVLDLEEPHNPIMDKATLILWVHDFINLVSQATEQKVIIYTGKWFSDYYNDFDGQFAVYPLWVSSYVDSYDQVPVDFGGWSSWVGWQHTDKGQIAGIQGFVDLDIVNDLDAIKIKVAPVEPPLPTFLLTAVDADAIINRWITDEYDFASDADKTERHRLANELRKASGQPTT